MQFSRKYEKMSVKHNLDKHTIDIIIFLFINVFFLMEYYIPIKYIIVKMFKAFKILQIVFHMIFFVPPVQEKRLNILFPVIHAIWEILEVSISQKRSFFLVPKCSVYIKCIYIYIELNCNNY